MENSDWPARPAWETVMNMRILTVVVLAVLVSACGQDEPAKQQQKTFGGQLGDSYKGMLNDAKQGVEDANEQMQRTDQAVRERNE
jgi:hypothetical protein